MTALILGLIIFFGMHSVRIVSDDFRSRQIAKVGSSAWKGMYAAVSLVGFVLIVVGYSTARLDPVVIWIPPVWTYYVSALLLVPAFVLIAASFVSGTRIRAKVGHPMLLGIKVWALAHLIANGTLADLLLFGAFLIWSVIAYASARRRDRKAGTVFPIGPIGRDLTATVSGIGVWVLFAFWLHAWLFGVAPLAIAVASA